MPTRSKGQIIKMAPSCVYCMNFDWLFPRTAPDTLRFQCRRTCLSELHCIEKNEAIVKPDSVPSTSAGHSLSCTQSSDGDANASSKLANVVTLVTCIQEVSGLNLGRNTISGVLPGFCQCLQVYNLLVPRLRRRSLPCPFQFIVYRSL